MIRRIVAVAVAVLAPGCEAEVGTTAAPITKGTPAGDDVYLATGGILTSKGSLCTGTLVSPTTVLTAAHCVDPKILQQAGGMGGAGGGGSSEPIEYKFTFSRDLRNPDPALTYVATVDWHDTFPNITGADFTELGPKQWNDVAVMHLERPVEGRPIARLPTREEAPGILTVGVEAEVVGYGMTDDTDPMSAGKLHQGLSHLDVVGDWEIQAGAMDEQQACRGDSGGPVFVNMGGELVQVGVASRLNARLIDAIGGGGTPPPCTGGLLYTRIDAYLPWITERVEDLGQIPIGVGEDGDMDPGPDTDPDGTEDIGDEDGGCRVAPGSRRGAAGLCLLLAICLVGRRRVTRGT